jgi:hypothetical protein
VFVETRLIFRRASGWDYAVYQWQESGADAELLEGNWVEQVLELEDGRAYTIPARLDCRTCHETSESTTGTPVLGITSYQLTNDLAESSIFDEEPNVADVDGESAEETLALGYFVGNCISCHDGGRTDNSAFSLYPELARVNTVGVATEGETAPGVRVVAGDPSQSVLYEAVVEAPLPGYTGAYKEMPPLGLDRADPEASEILGNWISGL